MVDCAGKAMQLSDGQREAIRTAARSPVCVVTGGPGCGKTTTTKYIVTLWAAMKKRLAICAPTGDPQPSLLLHTLPPPSFCQHIATMVVDHAPVDLTHVTLSNEVHSWQSLSVSVQLIRQQPQLLLQPGRNT